MLFTLCAALVAFAATGAYGKCPASINAVTASVTQIFGGARSPYDWTFSPTTPSSMAPNGATTCGPSYVAQYSGGNCDSKCTKQEAAPASSSNACQYSFGDGEVRTMNIRLTCDAGATALTINNEVHVTQRGGGIRGLTYDFIGRYAGVCEGGSDGDDEGPKGSGGCGGGCVFVIIFFVGAALYVAGTVAFNYYKLGKRGKELAPHPEFWLLIPGLLKDGAIFSFQMATKPCRKDEAGSTYTQV